MGKEKKKKRKVGKILRQKGIREEKKEGLLIYLLESASRTEVGIRGKKQVSL